MYSEILVQQSSTVIANQQRQINELNQKLFSKDKEKNDLIEQIGNQYLQVQKDHEIEIQVLKDQIQLQHILKNGNTRNVNNNITSNSNSDEDIKQQLGVVSSASSILNKQHQQQQKRTCNDNQDHNKHISNNNIINSNNKRQLRPSPSPSQRRQFRQLPLEQKVVDTNQQLLVNNDNNDNYKPKKIMKMKEDTDDNRKDVVNVDSVDYNSGSDGDDDDGSIVF